MNLIEELEKERDKAHEEWLSRLHNLGEGRSEAVQEAYWMGLCKAIDIVKKRMLSEVDFVVLSTSTIGVKGNVNTDKIVEKLNALTKKEAET